MVSKGDRTRQVILAEATRLAARVGLEAITIGELSRRLELSKSGLFAHFRSKERLQIEVVHAASALFVERVVRPAVREPRGRPRVQALFERWIEWATSAPGGCIFVGAAAEFDDRPGAVRDAIAASQRQWLDTLARAASIAVEEGHFNGDVDPAQFAFEAYASMLGAHLVTRLLDDDVGLVRARLAFDRLLASAC